MKQLIALLSLLIIASPALAKHVSIKAGVSYWHTDSQGSLSAPEVVINDLTYELALDKKSVKGLNNGFAHFAIENSVTGVPNFRFSYNHLKSDGKAELVGIPLNGGIDFTHYDITAYYKIPIKKIEWDIGLTARTFDGSIVAKEYDFSSPLNKTYGLIYSDIKWYVFSPSDGFVLGLLAQAGKTNNEEAADLSLYFQYTLPEHIGLTWGYRYIDIDLKAKGKYDNRSVKVKTNYISRGPFLGLHLHF